MPGKHMPMLAILGDDPVDLLVINVFLLKAGFRTCVASSGSDVCNRVERGDVLDCIVITASEVGRRGILTIGLIRSWEISRLSRHCLPILVILSNDVDHLRAECVTAGADAFLILPLVYSVTVNTIFDLVEAQEGKSL